MTPANDEGTVAIRTAFESLKPLESFTIEGQGKRILVACLEFEAYAISCWCKETELGIKIQDILQARGIPTYHGAKNQKGRVCVVAVASNTADGEYIVLNMVTVLGLPPKPNASGTLITTSRIDLD